MASSPAPNAEGSDRAEHAAHWYRWYVLGLLILTLLFSVADRLVFSILIEPIKAEFKLSDTQLGLLGGVAFTVTYMFAGFPAARLTMALDWGDGPVPDLWTVPDASQPNGRAMSAIIQEDTQFGEAIQRSMASSGFRSVPLSYQEARIYYFHQNCDAMIGPERIPPELRVEPVLDQAWVWPCDPRRESVLAG